MTTINFANLDSFYDMFTHDLSYGSAGVVENGGDFSYGNNLSPLDDIELTGATLGYIGGSNPISGSFTQLEIAIGNGNETNPDVVITLDSGIDAQLIGNTNDALQNEILYREILAGNTAFVFGGSNAGATVAGDFFDAVSGETLLRGTGAGQVGDDTFTGNGGNNSYIRGDGNTIAAGASVYGGWDTFNGAFDWVIGDVFSVTDGTLNGGRDVFNETIAFTGDPNVTFTGDVRNVFGTATVVGGPDQFISDIVSNTDYDLHGDARFIDGASTVTGGDDFFSLVTNGNVIAHGDSETVLNGAQLIGGDDTISLAGGAAASSLLVGDAQSIDGANVVGGNDSITGGANGDRIFGDVEEVFGSSTLTGGDDILEGGGGNDTIYGDTLNYPLTATVIGGNDTLRGGDGADQMYGNGGNDVLDGGDGNDTMDGGEGNDTFIGGAGADSMHGGSGDDWVDYSGASTGIQVIAGLSGSSGDAAGDTLSHIDNIIGTAFDDYIRGQQGSVNNFFRAGAGDDRIRPRGGRDTVYAGAGDDRVEVYGGHDAAGEYYNGGAGQDTFNIVGYDNGDTFDFRDDTLIRFEILTWNAGVANGPGVMNVFFLAEQYLQFTSVEVFGDTAGYSMVLQIDMGDLTTFAYSLPLAISSPDDFARIIGDGDAESIEGSSFREAILGNGGNDTLSGLAGEDTLDGGAGNDLLDGGDDDDTLIGGSGNDEMRGGSGDDAMDGGTDADRLYGGIGNDTLLGGDGADKLVGNAGADSLDGGTGRDTLLGGSGCDVLEGDLGHDVLRGGLGNDWLSGGVGDDFLHGEGGNDRLYGGGQNDTLLGYDGDDTLYGGSGGDVLRGNAGADRLYGGGGYDLLVGGTGRDTMYGGQGNDNLQGSGGHDTLYGGAGNDTLIGGLGFDRLDGGIGNDVLIGGFNADRFVFADGHGDDTINDFDATNNSETIILRDVSAISDYADLAANHMTQVGANVVIDTGGGNSITLLKVDIADLGAGDFVF
ncbi:calcium-binding protein [Marimonas arenosa]|uniref:Alkaline phosphatase n=1 Tax=Marimonas arenosa TaxID=1795305 RepID=A0AAE4B6N0_9RHOB|nr:calcium-binding protein [Marimonas arenosa]MDQ2090606.1 hypothetical protein [Marimonas arenosa]